MKEKKVEGEIEWRISVFNKAGKEVVFALITDKQADALGIKPDGVLYQVEAYIGAWKK